MVPRTGIEPVANCLEGRRSHYKTTLFIPFFCTFLWKKVEKSGKMMYILTENRSIWNVFSVIVV